MIVAEIAFVIGVAFIAVGAWWIHPAVGMLTIGSAITAVAIGHKLSNSSKPEGEK